MAHTKNAIASSKIQLMVGTWFWMLLFKANTGFCTAQREVAAAHSQPAKDQHAKVENYSIVYSSRK